MNPGPDGDARPSSRGLHRRVTVGLQLVLLGGLALGVLQRQWMNVFLLVGILTLTLLPLILGRRFDVFIPPELELLAVAFVFASLFLGEIQGYYTRFAWWDKILHTGSGFLLGILGFLLVYVLNEAERVELHMRPAFVALFAFTFSVALGAVWEIYEFAMDGLLGLNMQKSGLVDTMWDLIVDTLGAGAMAALGYLYMRVDETSWLEAWIRRFVEANPRLFRG